MLHDPIEILRERFAKAMKDAFADDLPDDADPLIAVARDPRHGDYQSNAAMPLAKRLGRNPRDIAVQILEKLDLDDIAEPRTETAVAGPGFINIRLRRDRLAQLLEALDTPELGVETPATPKKLVVDLCGVNLAKQMHVGHLRSTAIGDAIARVFERLGHDVLRQNHLGDWGLPIAMVTDLVMKRAERGEIDLDALTLDDLDALYREAQRRCAPDRRGLAAVERFDLGPKARAELQEQVEGAEEALAEAKKTLVALQSGDEKAVAHWKRISDITVAACVDICHRLGAKVDPEHTAGESTYRDELAPLVEDLLARGVAEESQGAVIVRLDEFDIAEPLLIRKSDAGFLYATTDLAAIRRRVRKFGAERVIYAVDARQSLHFRQVFAAAHKAGYATRDDAVEASLEHAAFGTVLGEDNRPFKTRSGESVKLADLLEESVRRAEAIVAEKNPDLEGDERRRVAEAVGVGAIKYADLSSDRVKDYVFSFDRMLAFEGNTGPYLQYAYVRVRSIFRRAEESLGLTIDPDSFDDHLSKAAFDIDAEEEKTLALRLLQFPSALRAVGESLEPHRLCTYLYDLAKDFSAFFEACPVLRADTEQKRDARLRLCRLTARVLGAGLGTLGITPLERM
jgi:arginyl-tRNA synthetase